MNSQRKFPAETTVYIESLQRKLVNKNFDAILGKVFVIPPNFYEISFSTSALIHNFVVDFAEWLFCFLRNPRNSFVFRIKTFFAVHVHDFHFRLFSKNFYRTLRTSKAGTFHLLHSDSDRRCMHKNDFFHFRRIFKPAKHNQKPRRPVLFHKARKIVNIKRTRCKKLVHHKAQCLAG